MTRLTEKDYTIKNKKHSTDAKYEGNWVWSLDIHGTIFAWSLTDMMSALDMGYIYDGKEKVEGLSIKAKRHFKLLNEDPVTYMECMAYMHHVVEQAMDEKDLLEFKKEEPKKKAKKLDVNPDLFNCEYGLPEIARKLSNAIKNAPDECISLLFYGVPGTGKTHAIKYLAQELGIPYHNFVLSDMLGKYVGETEGKISEAFKKARGGVLHLDEFDSLTADRDGAEQQHQVSRVNAFLQAIDQHEGILICSTNLYHKLDKAVIRRFLMKQEFKNLTKEQVAIAAKHFFPKRKLKIESERIAPADFNIVKRSLIFEDKKDITSRWLEKRILEESDARMGKEEKKNKVGFDL